VAEGWTKKSSRRKGLLKTAWCMDMKDWNSNSTMRGVPRWQHHKAMATAPNGRAKRTPKGAGVTALTVGVGARWGGFLRGAALGKGFLACTTRTHKGLTLMGHPWPACGTQPQCPGVAYSEQRVLLGMLDAQEASLGSTVPTLA